MSDSYSDIVIQYFDIKALEYTPAAICLKRFRDAIVIIWPHSIDECDIFFDYTNKVDPTKKIQFTMEVAPTHYSFLDLKLKFDKESKQISVDVFGNDTRSFIYVLPSTCFQHHPDSPPSRNNLTLVTHLSHLATSHLSPTFSTLLPLLFPRPVPPCHLTPLSPICPSLPLRPTFRTLPPHHSPHLSHLATLPPFPTCHLPILLPLPLCHLTALPPFQPSQLTTLPPSQLVTLVLRDLTVAISITRNIGSLTI